MNNYKKNLCYLSDLNEFLSTELGTNRENETTLVDNEGQFTREEFSLVAD